MRRLTLEIIAAMALTLAAILTSVTGVMASDVMVNNAFARASATPQASSAAIYVTLTNSGAEADRLVAIATPGAGMAHLHETRTADGVMSMEMIMALDLAPGATVAMAPGGLHIMLMDLKAPLKKGASISLELTFEKAGKVTIEVPVGGVAATGPEAG